MKPPISLFVPLLLSALSSALSGQKELQRIQLANPTSATAFGRSLALSGDLAAVGAPDEKITANYQGRVYVYRRTTGGWVLEAGLQAPTPTLLDRFGSSVALSGSVLVVGAPAHLSKTSNGAIHVFRRKNGKWVHEAVFKRGKWFGSSVAVSGNRIVAGAPWTRLPRLNWGGPNHAGAAWVFRYDGTKWVEEGMLKASDAYNDDHFGSSVAIQGTTILVGASGEGDEYQRRYAIGAVYAFEWSGTSWIQKQKFRATRFADNAAFGSSISMDGGVAVVGSPGKKIRAIWNAGAAYIFRKTATGWVQEQKLASPWPAQMASFGGQGRVALQGGLCLVGSGGRDASGRVHGAVHAWRKGPKGWKLEPSFSGSGLTTKYSRFGTGLALDRGALLVGGYLENQAPRSNETVWVFDMKPDFRVMVRPLPVVIKDTASFEVRDAPGGAAAVLLWGFQGTARIPLPWPGAVLGLKFPMILGAQTVGKSGGVAWDFDIPASALGVRLWVQTLEIESLRKARTSNVIYTKISLPL